MLYQSQNGKSGKDYYDECNKERYRKRFGGVSKDNQIYLQIAHTQNEEAAKALALGTS